jgi:recombination protein RecA
MLLPKLKSRWNCSFIDAEHAFDRNYAEKLGVDIENLIISQPDNGEQALKLLRT